MEYIPLSIYKLSLDVIFRLWNIGKIDTYLIQSYRCYFCTCHEKASTTNKEIQSTGSHSSFMLLCIIRCETVKAWEKMKRILNAILNIFLFCVMNFELIIWCFQLSKQYCFPCSLILACITACFLRKSGALYCMQTIFIIFTETKRNSV